MPAAIDARHARLKAATRDLIKLCGGIERTGAVSGYSPSQVGRWNAQGDPDLPPLCAVASMEADAGRAVVTEALAEMAGLRLVPVAAPEPAGDLLIHQLALMRSSADTLGAMAQALADNAVTPSEAEQVDRTVAALSQTVTDIRLLLAAIKAGGRR